MMTGVDIVREQIWIADGKPLSVDQQDIRLNGWAIECRINAADPAMDSMPSPGEIEALELPEGPGVRIDTHFLDRLEKEAYAG